MLRDELLQSKHDEIAYVFNYSKRPKTPSASV